MLLPKDIPRYSNTKLILLDNYIRKFTEQDVTLKKVTQICKQYFEIGPTELHLQENSI